MVIVRNRYQKWKKHDEISKIFNFEVTDVNPLTPDKLRKNGTFKQQMAFFWPCLTQFCPNPHEKCFLAWTVAVSFGLRTFSSISPSMALRDLAHKPVSGFRFLLSS